MQMNRSHPVLLLLFAVDARSGVKNRSHPVLLLLFAVGARSGVTACSERR
jgi:hypothetical protein